MVPFLIARGKHACYLFKEKYTLSYRTKLTRKSRALTSTSLEISSVFREAPISRYI
jgi:hypothetical protein